MSEQSETKFTGYQRFVAGLMAFLQFAVILDFMIMSPLGALIMPALEITPRQFGLAVSAYAFSAGTAGFLTAGFADRFDRKRLLLFFYSGFIGGTLWCGLADSFPMLLAARIITGLFGGVIGSVLMAIITDLFAVTQRGRVMGVVQSAFAASQVLGLPAGLYLSNHWTWHAPFLAIAAVGVAGGLVIALRMKPVADHLALKQEHSALAHLVHTVAEPRFVLAFCTTAVLTTGGFMLMPFGSAFSVHNLGIELADLPTIYLVTGLCTIFFAPAIGRLTDRIGRAPVFLSGSALTATMVVIYTHLGTTSLPVLIAVNVIMFLGIFSRMIPYQTLVSTLPEPVKRGSFNAVNAAVQQIGGGVASFVAAQLITAEPDGRLIGMPMVGYVVIGTTLVSVVLAWRIQIAANRRLAVEATA
ncbi:MAG TPA: MFS transporter [Magnetospirillaceae bacterium]|nr:MFS transporter [Magnetospirillaceae bacterium]